MQRRLCYALIVIAAATGIAIAEPVTPDASQEARALLRAITRISGRNTLSGQHNLANTRSSYSEQVQKATGKTPAIWSSDFGFAATGDDAITGRDALSAEAKRQFADGCVIALTWRAVRPVEDEPSGLKNSVQAKLADEQWQELLTAGSPLRKRWEAQVDVIAGYLKQLRDSRIPVLWRPYAEANGAQYWWAGRAGDNGSSALYKQLFERLATYHKLNNLIWVWTATTDSEAGAPESFYPGSSYCDLLAAGVHDGNYAQALYDSMGKLAAGKPIALGEVGGVPTPAVLKSQMKWTWFMVWADLLRVSKPEVVRELFNDEHTLSRGNRLP